MISLSSCSPQTQSTMAEDLIKVITTQATSILIRHIKDQLNSIVNLEQDINKLVTTLKSIQAGVADAEKREIELHAIEVWVQNLKFISYEIDDTMTDWRTAILQVNGDTSRSNLTKKVCLAISFPCFSSNRMAPFRQVAIKIRNINQRLVSIDDEKNAFRFANSTPNLNGEEEAAIALVETESGTETTSFADSSTVFGRDRDRTMVLNKLIGEDNPPIIFVWGMGGIGKTTFAQSMFNCDEVQQQFKPKMWVSVGKTFDRTRIAKAIVEEARGSSLVCNELQSALRHVSDSVNGKKFLLVLDNVWAEDENSWKPLMLALRGGAPGSKILITSRNEGVGKNINAIVGNIELFSVKPLQHNQVESAVFMHHLTDLPDEDCWAIFKSFAFAGRSSEFYEDLKATGRKISDKCKGLPLAAKTIGSAMLSKNTNDEWEHVLDDKIWQLEVEDGLSRALLLSYHDLPSAMKRCFCYCANFPKDSKIDAANLIQIWMAQGYLSSGGSDEMEITGRGYLNNLVTRSLFQEVERNKDDQTVLRFKMHDMVHDMATYLMKSECIIATDELNLNQDPRPWMRFRHLIIIHEDDHTFPVPPKNSENLYTFSIQSFHDCPPIVKGHSLPPKFFHHFKYLKTLDLSRNTLLILPDDIDKLTNLHYVNLSHNPFYKLPETVCKLQNLQTLKLVSCYHLTELPQSIGELTNLRHLEIDQTNSLMALPKGVGKLTSLRTLSKFIISNEDASCTISDLKLLNHLRGHLTIEGLDRVKEASEVKEAELEKKEHIVELHINCSSTTGLIEGLQLNKRLRALQIDFYGGQRFPSWMVSLRSLKKLRVQKWRNCVSLPPVGKLPLLEILHIEGLGEVKHVGHEFLGLEADASLVSSRTVFLKLKKLKFSRMEKWEEWDVMNCIDVMPSLCYLKLSHCDKLKSLPGAVLKLSLKKLRIRSCVLLRQRYDKETGEDGGRVSHIPNVRISGR